MMLGGMPLSWIVVLLPWGGALLLALLPPRGRLPGWVNLGLSAVSCGLALALLAGAEGQQGWTRTDALNLPLIALAGVVGLATAAFSAATLPGEPFDGLRARLLHAAFQLFMGAQFLALLSDNLGVMWVAIEIATLACVLLVALQGTPAAIEAAWKLLLLCGVGLALALFGTILLYLAVQPLLGQGDPGLSWAAMRAVAARSDPGMLSLAFIFLLLGYGTQAGLVPLHGWLPDAEAEAPLPISAVLSGLLLNAALLALLRAKAIIGPHAGLNAWAMAPGPLLVALGLASLLLAGFALWRRRDVRRLFAWSSIGHIGLASIAFGLGANLVGLLHLMGHSLVKSAVIFAVGAAVRLKGSQRIADIGGLVASHPVLGWGLALGIAGLAGMPPLSLFVSEFQLVAQAAAQAPWLALPLGIGLLVAGIALIRALQRLCLGDPTPDRPGSGAFALPGGLAWAHGPVWGLLLLSVLLGFAAPGALLRMLAEAADLLR